MVPVRDQILERVGLQPRLVHRFQAVTSLRRDIFGRRFSRSRRSLSRRNAAEERRVRKLQQIKQLLSIVLGPDVDLNQEAKDVIKQWEETVEMEVRPPGPKTPLQSLLREYHDICEDIQDIEGEGRPGKE